MHSTNSFSLVSVALALQVSIRNKMGGRERLEEKSKELLLSFRGVERSTSHQVKMELFDAAKISEIKCNLVKKKKQNSAVRKPKNYWEEGLPELFIASKMIIDLPPCTRFVNCPPAIYRIAGLQPEREQGRNVTHTRKSDTRIY